MGRTAVTRDETDETRMTGVGIHTRYYVEKALDDRVGPLEESTVRQDERISALERKVTTLFNLLNADAASEEPTMRRGMTKGQKAGAAAAGGTGLMGIAYAVVEVLKAWNG